jgi:hypothetical protein
MDCIPVKKTFIISGKQTFFCFVKSLYIRLEFEIVYIETAYTFTAYIETVYIKIAYILRDYKL